METNDVLKKSGTRLVWLCLWIALGMVLAPEMARAQESGPPPSAPVSKQSPAPAGSEAQNAPAHAASASPDGSTPAAASSEPVDAGKPPRPRRAYGMNPGLPAPGTNVRRETPRETLSGFLEATSRSDYPRAAHFLSLSHLSASSQRKEGPELARKLAEVMGRKLWVDMDAIPDEPKGTPGDAPAKDDLKVGVIPVPRGEQGIRLVRVRDVRVGAEVWVFSPTTVRSIDRLHELYGLPGWLDRLPKWMRAERVLGLGVWQWIGLALLGLLSWLVGAALEPPLLKLIRRAGRRMNTERMTELMKVAKGPLRQVVILLVFMSALSLLSLPVGAATSIERLVYVGLIWVGMKVAIRLVSFAAWAIQQESHKDLDDEMRIRAVQTRVAAVRRVAIVLIVVVGVALVLVQFPSARSVGISLLGSAGIAGAILGFAAQKTFSNLFAGILISLTQPIRIGDTVIVEKEWGKIEEIGSTHVVVRIWDLRRLVLPVTYFLDKPFENWTKTAPELVGTVFVHADYRVDVAAVRAELQRILEGNPLWNGESQNLVVYDVTDKTAILRASVSSDDASKLWDLRCEVREKLLAYLQQDWERFPKWRMDTRQLAAGAEW